MRLRSEFGMTVVRSTYFAPIGEHPAIDARESAFGWHGGLIETALMLAIRPDLVRVGEAADFRSVAEDIAAEHSALRVEGETGLGWMAEDLNLSGATGNAAAATVEIGRTLLNQAAGRLGTLLAELHAFQGIAR